MFFISNWAVFQLYRGVIRTNRVIISNNISFLPGYRYFTHAFDVCHLKLFVGGHISFSYCPWYVINIDFMYFSCTVTGSSSNPNFREIILILYLLYVGRRVWRYQREVIMFRKSKKDRQHNNKKKKDKRTKKDLQNINIKLKIE